MNLVSVECPSCGANLPPRAPTGHYTCDYCGAQFAQQQVKHAHDQAGHAISTDQLAQAIVKAQQMSGGVRHSAAPEVYNIPPQQAQKAVRRVMFFVAFTIVLSAAIPMYFTMRSSGLFGGSGSGGGGGSVVGGGGLTSEHLLWDDNGGPPAPVTIDGKPAVIGRTRAVGSEDALYIDAYTMDGERVWRVDGLGTYGDGYRHTRFAVAGSSVVISDKDAKLRIVSTTSGAPQHEVTLTDRVDELCVTEGEGDAGVRVWVRQIDKKVFALDPVSAEQSEGEVPEACLSASELRRKMMRDRTRRNKDESLEVEGVRVTATHEDDGLAVATGVKHPGTEVPRAIGFNPETNEVLWDEVVSKVSASSNRSGSSQHAALANKRYFRVYGEGQELWHVAALDAETGSSLWDQKLRPIFAVDSIDGLYASDTHVFVVRTSSMEVLDATSGELVLTIGRETYD